MNSESLINTQIFTDVQGEESAKILKDSNTEIEFEESLYNAPHGDYEYVEVIKLVISALIALLNEHDISNSSGKHSNSVDNNAHILGSLYKINTSSKHSNYLSIGFDQSNARRKLQLTDYKDALKRQISLSNSIKRRYWSCRASRKKGK